MEDNNSTNTTISSEDIIADENNSTNIVEEKEDGSVFTIFYNKFINTIMSVDRNETSLDSVHTISEDMADDNEEQYNSTNIVEEEEDGSVFTIFYNNFINTIMSVDRNETSLDEHISEEIIESIDDAKSDAEAKEIFVEDLDENDSGINISFGWRSIFYKSPFPSLIHSMFPSLTSLTLGCHIIGI